MGLAQKWLAGMLGLAAGALILSNPKGFGAAASGVKTLVGGTANQIIRGK